MFDGVSFDRSADGSLEPPFAALSWPGFAGAVTGFNPSLALSEKVNDLHGGGTPAGTYAGQATPLVLRDVLQFAQAKRAARI